MNSQKRASGLSKLCIAQQALSFFLAPMLALVLLFAACPPILIAQAEPGPLTGANGDHGRF